jgi:hypothetical protein
MSAQRSELSTKIEGVHSGLSERIDGLRNEMNMKIDGVHNGLNAKIDGLRNEMLEKEISNSGRPQLT